MMKSKGNLVKGPHITRNLEKMFQKGITLADFNAPWCAPCRAQKPIMDELACQYRGRAQILELDVDEYRKAAMQMGITSIPTLIIFKNGREMRRFVGLQPAEVLSTAIEKIL
jgi:thioredoxin 1